MKTTWQDGLTRTQFGDDFQWGVSTAAFQIEGACDEDGKGPSIWDVFAARRGAIRNGDNPGRSCDFYNLYEADIALARDLNIPNFRISLSWSRILPLGTGKVNEAGIGYYNKVIDQMLASGITPWVTLYHWDLPQELEDEGGWTNRDVISWFTDYATLCVQRFGDRVKNWIILNEPSVFTGAGYFLGIHAPGRRRLSNYLKAIHYATMATSAAARAVRTNCPDAVLGTAFSCTHIEPASKSTRDVAAANRIDTLLNHTFIEPILGLGYPVKDLPILKKMERFIEPDDFNSIAFDFDFIGLQCYTREIVKANVLVPYIHASLVKASRRRVETTEMNWEVYPASIYHVLKKFNAYEGIRNILITENGAAFPDHLIDGEVRDVRRLRFLRDHLHWVLKAKGEGVKVKGYFVWTLQDNFEWAEGYHPRFGLIHVDFETQKRTVKLSGHWYREFLSETESKKDPI